jgi:hypothetical protein
MFPRTSLSMVPLRRSAMPPVLPSDDGAIPGPMTRK